MEITNEDIQRGREAEGRNEKMNMMNSAQKANSKAFDKGYDGIQWDDKPKPKPVPMIDWYGYLHFNDTLHVKRYFGDRGDIDEAIESDFVALVKGPFKAESRQEALKILRRELNE